MDRIAITNASEIEIDWTKEPVFDFATEVDALQALEVLGDDLRVAREQVRQIMRYMSAAIIAARSGTSEDGAVSPQAIIGHSGLARQTVYNLIGEKTEQQE